MDQYKKYMDSVEPSPEFQERLRGLTAPRKTPAWRKYGAMAAALVLVLGLGAWGFSRTTRNDVGQELGEPQPELGEVVMPVPEPYPDVSIETTQTMGGYEVRDGEVASYYMLPYIEYGKVVAGAAQDIAAPEGVSRRDLTQEELIALLGGETNVISHLNWSGYDLYAHAMVYEDGTLWALSISGRKGDTGLEHFDLDIAPGGLPASCIVYPESEPNEIWGTEVTADGYDGERAFSRRVSFMHEDYGFRFEITGTDKEAIEELTARAVRFIILHEEPAGNSGSDDVTTVPYDPSAGAEESAETMSPIPSPAPMPEEDWGIRISAEDVTPAGMTLVLERTAVGYDCMTGTPFHLERYENGQWVELELIPYEGEGERVWTDIGWLFPEETGGRYEHSVGWTLWYGELSAGQYRMAKEVYRGSDKGIFYVEFEIAD